MRRTKIHFAFNLINILLSILNHLHCLLPFFLESCLSLFNLLFLNLNPFINLLLFSLERSWWELILFEQLLDMLTLLLLFEFEDFFAELDQLRLLAVLHDYIKLLLWVLLEGVAIEKWISRLTPTVIQIMTIESVYALPFDTIRLDRRLGLSEVKFTVWDVVGWQRLLRLIKVIKHIFTSPRLGCLNRNYLMELLALHLLLFLMVII